MKNRSRLTALLLALVMLLSMTPAAALADVIQTVEDYQNAVQSVKDELSKPSVPQEEENSFALTRTVQEESIVRSANAGTLEQEGSYALPLAGRLTLTAPAAEGYQWQIRVGDVWANIVGDNGPSITLTYAKVQNALAAGGAQVRCVLVNGSQLTTSPVATVTVDSTIATETKSVEQTIPVTSFYVPAKKNLVQELNADVLADGNTDTPATYTIIINYVFANGTQAANPWTATVATGSTYEQDIQSPVVIGYTPSETVVHVDSSVQTNYTVTYKPAEVEFTVKHYQQNVANDEYTLVDTETKNGFTESVVGEKLAKADYTGFYSLLYDTTTKIAADGSTVVEIKYDRYYYLMNFELDGGYGVEPIYARYGAPVSIGTPTKPGYTFTGWDKEIPATMPAGKSSYKANWKAGESGFTVVFWYENANDDGYSVAGTYKPADVAPGTKKKSDDYKNQSFTGRDDNHFTYNAAKAETVTVKGDGSTVLNVYYTRNTYTLTFKEGGAKVLSCGKVEHSHSHAQCCTKEDGHWWSCNTKKCPVGYEHTHRNSCYKNSDLTITAKYQQDIHSNFPILDEAGKTIWWEVPSGTTTYVTGNELGSIDIMPGENITFENAGSTNETWLWYYVETLNGQTVDTNYSGKSFKLYKKINCDGNSTLTYKEEFHAIEGFTQWKSDPTFDSNGKATQKQNNYFYYTRNSYSLKFYNYNAYVDENGNIVQYEAPLNSYYFVPEYPANLEKDAYVFDGWYTTAGCYAGSEADMNKMTMPAADVVLYAKWVPKTHTVTTWLTDKMDVGVEVGNTGSNEQTVAHGTQATKPTDPTNGGYDFVGWFYKENGEEKAFDFSMPVNRDLELYAKWSFNKLVEYTIRYAVKNDDDTLTYIAGDTTGSALAGTTKTFNAKTGKELNEGYQSGYFPTVSSHSLTMDIKDTTKNEFTFIYVAKPEVTYTVKYLEKGTNNQLADPKTVTTRDAVVTETFKQIDGYAPDAYQKQLVLAAEGNEIIFWYVKDELHAPVQVIHWVQNIVGDGYTEYQSSTDLNAEINKEKTSTALNIDGFEYKKGTAVVGNSSTEFDAPATPKGTLTAAGLVLNLYYDRIEYPYVFRFVEKDSDPERELADSVTGSARYQAQVVEGAKSIPGYTLVSAENQSINIAIEDGVTAVKNVKTFYYTEQTVEIKYQVVGPDGCGELDNYQESQLKVTTGQVKGSKPTAAQYFKFVGWYKNEACTEAVVEGWVGEDNKLTPEKTKNYGTDEKPVMGYEAATYYAKFEYNLTTLTITKTGCADIDNGQSFLFKVEGYGLPKGGLVIAINGNGSETISGLTVGQEYTVTEITEWSWRYTPESSCTIKLEADASKNSVEILNERKKTYWLDGDCYKENNFGN